MTAKERQELISELGDAISAVAKAAAADANGDYNSDYGPYIYDAQRNLELVLVKLFAFIPIKE